MDANDLHLFFATSSHSQIWRQEVGYLEMLTPSWADNSPIEAVVGKKFLEGIKN